MSRPPLIIAIDGGAGTGTSTAAKGAAEALGIPHLNTGELYRGITHAVLKAGGDPLSEDDAIKAARAIEFELEAGNVVKVNGEDVRGILHSEPVNKYVSQLSSFLPVRDEILSFQREYAAEHGVVAEGRDTGTRIFPDAPLKFYFTCDPEVRVKRLNLGDRSHETVATLEERDARDKAKPVGALKQAEDAVVIDTTDLTIDEVVGIIVKAAHSAGY